MSLLTIVQNAMRRPGLTAPSAAYASSDLQVLQVVALAQEEGKALAARHDWQVLCREHTFTSTATATQTTSAVPTDFGRYIPETFYNRSQKREVVGPMAPQEWQFSKSVITSNIVPMWRMQNNLILLTPTPTSGHTHAFEYVTKNWCQSSGGTGQSAWAADTDTALIDEELITLGVRWRLKASKGLDYAEDFNAYELQANLAIQKDGGKARIMTDPPMYRRYPSAPIPPEGSWNL